MAHATFRKWFDAGILPAPVEIEGVLRWHLAEVREWLAKLPRRRADDDEHQAA